ncbi:MAG: hypothetical protein ACFB5Z_16525 [Elainellaceae cyanobacterium]
MTIAQRSPLGPAKFLVLWTAANLLGGFIVGFLENNGLQFMATLVLAGAIAGACQWLVLRYAGYRLRWWAIASALGWIVGTFVRAFSQALYGPIATALYQQFGLWEGFWLNLLAAPITVLGMAVAQSILLGRGGRWTGGWLLASLLGGVALGVVGAGLCAAFCPSLSRSAVGIVDGLGWAGYGVITGVGWLMLSSAETE